MNATPEQLGYVLDFFTKSRPRLQRILPALVDDADAVIEQAGRIYEDLAANGAYVDKPHNPLATALFSCNVNLAVYLALKPRGVGVHDFGVAVLRDIATADSPPADDEAQNLDLTGEQTHPGEFVLESLAGDGESFAWGYNITSCAICYQFSRHDAMELVPYMCASDDVVSDRLGQGLRRNGTIALGAHQCDFRYQPGGEPKRVAEHYPDKIKFVDPVSPDPQ